MVWTGNRWAHVAIQGPVVQDLKMAASIETQGALFSETGRVFF
jgi:hypothetical protein